MRRSRPELSIFTMSALDVLATATGVFVLLLVLVMPYYRKSFDAGAEITARRVAAAETRAQVAAIDQATTLYRGGASAARAEAERLNTVAAALERRAATHRSAANTTSVRPVPATGGNREVVGALDLVFAIDTTASMGPVIRELASSMRAIVRIVERLVPSVRVGIAAYSDTDTGLPPLEVLPLTSAERDLPRIMAFVDGLRESPFGSPTIEEDVHLGLGAAMSMQFRPDALQSIILIGDAEAHPEFRDETLFRVRAFVGRGDKRSVSALFTTTPSSLRGGPRSRTYFANVARAGNGSFNDYAGSMIASVLLSLLVD